MEEIPQSFNGLFHAIMAKLKEEREKRRRVEDSLDALKADFTNYQREAKKRHEFLLSRMDEVMQTHAKNFEEKVREIRSTIPPIHLKIVELESFFLTHDKQIADLRDTKTNNNMKGA